METTNPNPNPDFRESEKTMSNNATKIKTMENPGLIPIKDIVADKKWNVRLTTAGIEELAADIKARGLISPITVRPLENKPGKYQLILGYRRFAAVTLLGWEAVPTTQFLGSESDALLLNLSENTQRQELSTYEIAVRCKLIKDDFDISSTVIAGTLGKSKSYVENLIRSLQQLAKPILEAWANPDHQAHGLCSTNNLNRLSAMEQDQQLARWDELRGHTPVKTDTTAATASSDSEKHATPKRPSAVRLAEAIEAVKNDEDLDDTARRGMLAALAWAMGKTQKLMFNRAVVYVPSDKRSKKAESNDEE